MSRRVKILAVSAVASIVVVAMLAGAAAAQGGGPWRGDGRWGNGMIGGGMMGGRYLGSFGAMRITAGQAITLAQRWLDARMPGTMAGDEADQFYGYYTIHTMADGAISGMLSVSGYTGQVWYHSWHGDFIDMIGEEAV